MPAARSWARVLEAREKLTTALDAARSFAETANTVQLRSNALEAAEYLEETGAGEKYVLIFSDLEEDLQITGVDDTVGARLKKAAMARPMAPPRAAANSR